MTSLNPDDLAYMLYGQSDRKLRLGDGRLVQEKTKVKLPAHFDKSKILGNVADLKLISSGHCTLLLTKKRSLESKDTLSTKDRILVVLDIQNKSYKEKSTFNRYHTLRFLNNQGLMIISFSLF